MQLEQLLQQIKTNSENVQFSDVIAVIDANYDYQDCDFTNGVDAGAAHNAAGTNIGSCKIFAFGLLQQLTEAQTLACFGDYYRQDVLLKPAGNDHQNIRNFIKSGWAGVSFKGQALSAK